MMLNERLKSTNHQVLAALSPRMTLPKDSYIYFNNLKKGYEGECKFDELCEKYLPPEWFVLRNLHYTLKGTDFQIDSILISQYNLILVDIKNFENDYYIKDGNWYTLSQHQISNPIAQKERIAILFQDLLNHFSSNLLVETYLLFINPAFTLYQAPIDSSLILPTQINRFMKTLNEKPIKLSESHHKLAEFLLSNQTSDKKHKCIPEHRYDMLKKGITCEVCNNFMKLSSKRSYLKCTSCGCEEKVEKAFIRNVLQYRVLFPEKAITTNNLVDWCEVLSDRTVSGLLRSNYKFIGHGKSVQYLV
ncbi:nuclease-related domain-containing protein [Evansella cellulosilytica]|uniref:NERD domain protein n=1 Tax=Evansella cellulosilytica (strain ATCC 21833 / DSM 2522 / FERM P-1141 / JCM 9156 / N-4) TaxID=649639 RepID=E6TU80_EVAC2|nr:nuclease-related domain-containing protein [Evansella cellulosilytica]ADU28540.1 NERD domain protein [Evansella cellulosilytica DSM 2522]